MSHEGKMFRGEKWLRFKHDKESWKDVEKDPNKMVDVKYYLENSKEETKSKGKK